MNEVSLEVEAVTPIFIAGADQRNIENEGLRAPSLKGLMRWWFRAIMGGVLFSSGSLDINEIKREEEKIWGSTNTQSNVLIKVSTIDTRIENLQIRGYRGLAYLSYGVSGRRYMKGKFKVNIYFKPTLHEEDKKKVIATLWMLLNLGNVGSRNRKGFGSLRVTNDTKIYNISFKNPSDVNELIKYLKLNIEECLNIFGWDGSKILSKTLPSFAIIAPNFWKMKLLDDIYPSDIDAINSIGEKIRQYREDRNNPNARHTRTIKGKLISYWVTRDYDAIKSIYTQSAPSTPQGSIFGLPHQFQFQSIDKKAVVRGLKHHRRASPLYIKIYKLDDNKFVIGLQLFKSVFLPEDKLLISDLRNPNVKAEVNLPSCSYLEYFLDKLSGRWITL